jgi:hypothetical protein
MKSFPIIKRQNLINCFDNLVNLYAADQVKILDMAELATSGLPQPFTKNAGDIAPQLASISHKINRVGDNYGRKVLILLIEELHKDLIANGMLGVTMNDFCNISSLELDNGVATKFLPNGHWNLEWVVSSTQGDEKIILPLRQINITTNDIVPSYIVQYVNQSIVAYNNENYLTALSLISIALEGTLRDALSENGYTYTHGAQSFDSYEIRTAEVSNTQNGFNLEFQNAMPRHHNDFLSEPNENPPHYVRIKRINKYNKWILEIRDVNYIKDFWSSDVVAQAGQINISGLGTALNVARDVTKANILDAIILPDDIDEVIQQVRNNLIHLSGDAMTNPIAAVNMSLEDFASDQARVFDTIWSICGAIDKLYSKIADGTI